MSLVRFRPEAPFRGFSSSGRAPPCQGGGSEFEPRNPLQGRLRVLSALCFTNLIRHHGQAVRQGPAKPLSPVRFWVVPPEKSTRKRGFFNDIRSLRSRMIYLRYDICFAYDIRLRRMKERILYHICVCKYIMLCISTVYHAAKPYIIK